ncbi:MAG: hypothetical protein H0W71_08245 [Sphingomonas sp.]|nr:hypothetical protein [Sphingomonas sp.]
MNDQLAKNASLLLLRFGTGGLLLVWGAQRLIAPATGPHLATRYYSGLFENGTLQLAYGAAEVALGALIILGLFRGFAYVAQAVILITGAGFIWRQLLDPLSLYLLDKDSAQILFFPSVTVAAATLVLLAFRNEDRWSADALMKGKRRK